MFPHITDDEFANATGVLEDFYANHLPSESTSERLTRVDLLGYGRWMTDYLTARARGRDHERSVGEMVAAIKRAAGITPPPSPSPTLPPAERRTGIPILRGRGFQDAKGSFLALGASYFHGVSTNASNPSGFDQDCAALASNGVNYLRQIAFLDGGTIRPDPWELAGNWDPSRIAPAIDRAYDTHGLRTFLTIFGGLAHWPTAGDRRRAVETACDIVETRREKILGVEITNEYWMNWLAFSSTSEMRDLAQVVRNRLGPDMVIALSALASVAGDTSLSAEGEASKLYANSTANLFTPHFDRDSSKVDGIWRPYRQPWENVISGAGGPLTPPASINNEPIGTMSSVEEDDNPDRQVIAFVISMISGQAGYVLHSDAGIWGGRRSPAYSHLPGNVARIVEHDTMPQILRGLAGAMKDLPPDLPLWRRTRHLLPDHPFAPSFTASGGGSTQIWPDGQTPHGVVRPYAAYAGDRFVCALLGIRSRFEAIAAKKMEIKIVRPGTWKVIFEGTLGAGEKLTIRADEAPEAVVLGRWV